MSAPGNTLPIRTVKKLEGTCCLYSGCRASADPETAGGAYCRPHAEAKKKRDREWAAKRRALLRKAKKCIVCRKPSRTSRCAACRKRIGSDVGSVGSARKEPRTKEEWHADGYMRLRTVGRGVRGQKSRAELDDDLRQDLTDAIAQVAAVRDSGIAQLRLPQVADLGRIARREAQSIVADRLLTAKRALEAVAESLCPGRSSELDRVRREAVDEE
ncbi:MAG: hypothetical protein AB7E70_19735 [Hyphomicrobiaceae bacterium]